MPRYEIIGNDLKIYFEGKPSTEIRNKMKAVGLWWNPDEMCWGRTVTPERLALAKELCEEKSVNTYERNLEKYRPAALKLPISKITSADKNNFEIIESILKTYVNQVMGEDNSSHIGNAVSKSQEFAWMNCLNFIKTNLSQLSPEMKKFELIFEYSLPGTVHERPDIFLLTENKVICLEFKNKETPQVDDNKDDVAQAIHYKEWLENHHKVTRDKGLEVKSYLVCTHKNARSGELRGIRILTANDFCDVITKELTGEQHCSFENEWLQSPRTEMPDMLRAIEILYREKRIPYISDVNMNCLNRVKKFIDAAKKQHKKILILINGVPGSGKTAIGQSIVFEENKNGKANAVYLSGNKPLVEVLQYQINQASKNENTAENAIQDMYAFKTGYFSNNKTNYKENKKVPEQSILVFDESQRAWDKEKTNRGFSEPEGLFDVGERIFKKNQYAVLIGLFGNGQAIYTGEEGGISLWEEALMKYNDWFVIASDEFVSDFRALGKRFKLENVMHLPVSLRADFIDCSPWVEKVISRNNPPFNEVQSELNKLQNTSMRILVTRDFAKVQKRTEEINKNHPDWKYGLLISNFAEQSVINKALPDWTLEKYSHNLVNSGEYGPWFNGACKNLEKACTVYGNQGLELDCPIVLMGGDYIRQNGKWIPRGNRYNYDVQIRNYKDPDTIVENNYRVLLTRARKEMIILIPNDRVLDETYQYFVDMGVDVL